MIRKELLETIRIVHSGRRHVPPEIAAELAEHVAMDQLSEREIAVLRLVARGIVEQDHCRRIAGNRANNQVTCEQHLVEIGCQ